MYAKVNLLFFPLPLPFLLSQACRSLSCLLLYLVLACTANALLVHTTNSIIELPSVFTTISSLPSMYSFLFSRHSSSSSCFLSHQPLSPPSSILFSLFFFLPAIHSKWNHSKIHLCVGHRHGWMQVQECIIYSKDPWHNHSLCWLPLQGISLQRMCDWWVWKCSAVPEGCSRGGSRGSSHSDVWLWDERMYYEILFSSYRILLCIINFISFHFTNASFPSTKEDALLGSQATPKYHLLWWRRQALHIWWRMWTT